MTDAHAHKWNRIVTRFLEARRCAICGELQIKALDGTWVPYYIEERLLADAPDE